jgi:hypothetical protein
VDWIHEVMNTVMNILFTEVRQNTKLYVSLPCIKKKTRYEEEQIDTNSSTPSIL